MALTHEPATSLLKKYLSQYDTGIKSGQYTPFTYPAGTYGAGLLILFFLIPPDSQFHNRFTRYVTFIIIACYHAWMITNCKGSGPAITFGVGIMAGWGTLWAAVLLVFTDSKKEFKRIARRELWVAHEKETKKHLATLVQENWTSLRNRIVVASAVDENGTNKAVKQAEGLPTITATEYFWESYPARPLRQRLTWVLHLLCSFRGIEWNWRVSGLPSLPSNVQKSLQGHSSSSANIAKKPTSCAGLTRFDTIRLLVYHNMRLLIIGYITIDILKIIMSQDPYFLGNLSSPAPSHLPAIIRTSYTLTKSYRLITTMCMVWLCLRSIFTLAPLVFCGLCGPAYLGVSGDSWVYPDQFGNYSNVLERGLAGWWGGWWHQMFRYAFEASGNWLCSILHISATSTSGKLLSLTVAFWLSGCLHAYGSLTQIGPTHPFGGPFLFFMLQPIGIASQRLWLQQLKRLGVRDRIPRIVGQVTNFVFTHAWFYVTAPLLTDDFALGGLWLFEPVGVSFVRGLGFGGEADRSVWRWGGRIAKWHSDGNAFFNGIAL